MSRPAILCTCGQAIPHGVTCDCQRKAIRARNRRHDARRPNSRGRGYTREWQRVRAEFLRLHPFCAFCGAEANTVDHKTAHRGDMALFWRASNLQALCQPCHDSTKQRLERRQAQP